MAVVCTVLATIQLRKKMLKEVVRRRKSDSAPKSRKSCMSCHVCDCLCAFRFLPLSGISDLNPMLTSD